MKRATSILSPLRGVLPLVATALFLFPAGCAHKEGDKTADQHIREGDRYYAGTWVNRDLGKALEEYRKAADLGSSDACCRIGQCYESGLGVPKNDSLAASWYAKGASQGNSEAQYGLGLDYELGRGVPKNDLLAYAWLNAAASSGNEKARARRDSLGIRMNSGDVIKAQKLSLSLIPRT